MDGSAVDRDQRARLAAFNFLAEQTQLYSEVLPLAILANGFTFQSTRVPLLGPQGIFKLEHPTVGFSGKMNCGEAATQRVRHDTST